MDGSELGSSKLSKINGKRMDRRKASQSCISDSLSQSDTAFISGKMAKERFPHAKSIHQHHHSSQSKDFTFYSQK